MNIKLKLHLLILNLKMFKNQEFEFFKYSKHKNKYKMCDELH